MCPRRAHSSEQGPEPASLYQFKACRFDAPPTIEKFGLTREKLMQVKLSFLVLATIAALVSGCMSSSADRPPNYVESQLTQDPLPRGSMVASPDLPDEIGEPE
jgi:hypothetical protein